MNNSKFTIRTATVKDTQIIINLVKRSLSEFNLTIDPESSESDLLDIEKTYINNGGIFDIIEHDKSEIIGTVALLKVDGKTAKLRKMYVHTSYRGLGLGKMLMDHALKKAVELQFQEIILETVHSMKTAIKLYEKYGFIKIENETADSPRCDVIMKRSVII